MIRVRIVVIHRAALDARGTRVHRHALHARGAAPSGRSCSRRNRPACRCCRRCDGRAPRWAADCGAGPAPPRAPPPGGPARARSRRRTPPRRRAPPRSPASPDAGSHCARSVGRATSRGACGAPPRTRAALRAGDPPRRRLPPRSTPASRNRREPAAPPRPRYSTSVTPCSVSGDEDRPQGRGRDLIVDQPRAQIGQPLDQPPARILGVGGRHARAQIADHRLDRLVVSVVVPAGRAAGRCARPPGRPPKGRPRRWPQRSSPARSRHRS